MLKPTNMHRITLNGHRRETNYQAAMILIEHMTKLQLLDRAKCGNISNKDAIH